MPFALSGAPAKPAPESWGSGFVDYPTMVQPILDKHCVRCHGDEDIAAGLDLSGGWTWAFNISYETLLKHNLVGFLRCNNADVKSSEILPPRTLGSGAALLADRLVSGHRGRIPNLARPERDLLMVWMDGNSNYYGTWDYTPHATCDAPMAAKGPLLKAMQSAGCVKCHDPAHVGNDWLNLQKPERSRLLRAPLAKSAGGLAWCRDRKAARGLPLVEQRLLPPDVFNPPNWPKRDESGDPVATFASTDDRNYQAMLAIIRQTRAEALSHPRVDMPGAEIVPGVCRKQAPMPLPDPLPTLHAALTDDHAVELSWPRAASTIGLQFELHRSGSADFAPSPDTQIALTTSFRFTDVLAPAGPQRYALVVTSGERRSPPVRTTLTMPTAPPPPAPSGLAATPKPGEVVLRWEPSPKPSLRYHVYRAKDGSEAWTKLTDEPLRTTAYSDANLSAGERFAYAVRSLDRRGQESPPTPPVVAAALPDIEQAVFVAAFSENVHAKLGDGALAKGTPHGPAKIADKTLDLRQGGYVTFDHLPEFDLRTRLSVECWVYFDEAGQMPVLLSCGRWRGTGWFLQRFGNGWRWHVGGVDCDGRSRSEDAPAAGGKPAVGRWIHLVCTFDGQHARVFQDGVQVALKDCKPDRAPWPGPLFVAQYGPAPSDPYQVKGRLAAIRIYQRAVTAEEALAAFKAGRP
ncbi:MAG: hypothetical protein FJ279_20300 [Planctomycetes bacterium]|nr:hypothetical protein [Planctomycetota bacterium]